MDALTIDEPTTGIGIDDQRVALTSGEGDADDSDGVNPDGIDINPDDYPDTTAYLNAVPGMVDYLLRMKNAPLSDFKEVTRHRTRRNDL